LFHDKQIGIDPYVIAKFFYSFLNESTGLPCAARIACTLTDKNAMSRVASPLTGNTHHGMVM
jgi:hypothetical protein